MKNEQIAVILLLIATLFLLITHLSTNCLEFSRYNTGWNGTSDFFSLPDRHTTEDILNTSSLHEKTNSTLLVIAPEKDYSAREISNYNSFIRKGNSIFLTDDFGTGNQLLMGIGSSIRILPGIVSSVDRAYNDSYAVVTYPVVEHTLTKNLSSLVLDKGAALEGGEPLIKTTLMSWIDTDKDRRISKKELLGRYTILTRESIGTGEIFVFSDPSIFINSMGSLDEKWDNRRFIENVIKTSSNLLVDQVNSRTIDTDGYSRVMQGLRESPIFTLIFIGMLLLGLIFLIISTSGVKK